METVIQEEGLEEVEAYVMRRQNEIIQYIVNQLIMDL